MVQTQRGKMEPILPGNTNEIMNKNFRPYSAGLRAHRNEKFEIRR